jgi:hypothetical protein
VRSIAGRLRRNRYFGVKLAHLSVFDLHYLKRTLEDYTSRENFFSKGFFGALKVRKDSV